MTPTFKEYLAEVQQTVTFDPTKETPDQVLKKVRQADRTATASPERAIRAQQQDIKDQTAALKTDKNDPFARDRLQIKQLEQRIAQLKMVLARKEANANKQQGANPATAANPGVTPTTPGAPPTGVPV